LRSADLHTLPTRRSSDLERLAIEDARRLYSAALEGTIGADEAVALRRHLLADQARLAAEDGLVMTLHPAVSRNHSDAMFEKFGADRKSTRLNSSHVKISD